MNAAVTNTYTARYIEDELPDIPINMEISSLDKESKLHIYKVIGAYFKGWEGIRRELTTNSMKNLMNTLNIDQISEKNIPQLRRNLLETFENLQQGYLALYNRKQRSLYDKDYVAIYTYLYGALEIIQKVVEVSKTNETNEIDETGVIESNSTERHIENEGEEMGISADEKVNKRITDMVNKGNTNNQDSSAISIVSTVSKSACQLASCLSEKGGSPTIIFKDYNIPEFLAMLANNGITTEFKIK